LGLRWDNSTCQNIDENDFRNSKFVRSERSFHFLRFALLFLFPQFRGLTRVLSRLDGWCRGPGLAGSPNYSADSPSKLKNKFPFNNLSQVKVKLKLSEVKFKSS